MTIIQLLRKITVGLLIGTVLGLIAWDIFIMAMGAPSESRLLMQMAYRHSVTLPFCAGLLVGHWFWPWKSYPAATWRTVVFVSIPVALVIFDLAEFNRGFYGTEHWWHFPLIWVTAGIFHGHYFFGLSTED